jgi:hypothetical protein
MADEQKTRWIYCNHCKSETRHVFLVSKDYRYPDENGPDEWGVYRLWSCAGCDACVLEETYSADYMIDDNGKQIDETRFYPKRGHTVRPAKYFLQLPLKLAALYKEIITSHNEQLNLMCAAGLRALVEGICADKGVGGRNLEEKIDGMERLLPKGIVKNLHNFRFIGNKAVHELQPPSDLEVRLALDVIEDILNFLYELDYKAKMLDNVRNRPDDIPF